MGLSSRFLVYARYRDGQNRRNDCAETAPVLRLGRTAAVSACLIWAGLSAAADTLRIATWNVELTRKGPGLLLGDILEGDPQVQASVAGIVEIAPDVLVLLGFDHDLEGHALAAFADRLAESGAPYPYLFTERPNTGVPTGLDLDGDGRMGEPEDAQSYGAYAGQGGMAVLSRLPMALTASFTHAVWADLPGARLPQLDGRSYYSDEARRLLRLPSVAMWDLQVQAETGAFHLLTLHANTPVFDGPEDRNGARGHDEVLFWPRYLEGAFGPVPDGPFVIAGATNLDPFDGAGDPAVMRSVLDDPRLIDPQPRSAEGARRAAEQGSVNADQKGDPALDTADWADDGPGNLRVDYLLPSADWQVVDSGLWWPPQPSGKTQVSRHALVWVDLAR